MTTSNASLPVGVVSTWLWLLSCIFRGSHVVTFLWQRGTPAALHQPGQQFGDGCPPLNSGSSLTPGSVEEGGGGLVMTFWNTWNETFFICIFIYYYIVQVHAAAIRLEYWALYASTGDIWYPAAVVSLLFLVTPDPQRYAVHNRHGNLRMPSRVRVWRQYVTSVCDVSMWRQYVTTVCDVSMWRQYVTSDRNLLWRRSTSESSIRRNNVLTGSGISNTWLAIETKYGFAEYMFPCVCECRGGGVGFVKLPKPSASLLFKLTFAWIESY